MEYLGSHRDTGPVQAPGESPSKLVQVAGGAMLGRRDGVIVAVSIRARVRVGKARSGHTTHEILRVPVLLAGTDVRILGHPRGKHETDPRQVSHGTGNDADGRANSSALGRCLQRDQVWILRGEPIAELHAVGTRTMHPLPVHDF